LGKCSISRKYLKLQGPGSIVHRQHFRHPQIQSSYWPRSRGCGWCISPGRKGLCRSHACQRRINPGNPLTSSLLNCSSCGRARRPSPNVPEYATPGEQFRSPFPRGSTFKASTPARLKATS